MIHLHHSLRVMSRELNMTIVHDMYIMSYMYIWFVMICEFYLVFFNVLSIICNNLLLSYIILSTLIYILSIQDYPS